jgi:hypothetical protein
MEKDLGTGPEWVAVEHHNTERPHVHVVVCAGVGANVFFQVKSYLWDMPRTSE